MAKLPGLESFWVAIPHEALLVIGEDYPQVADYLGWIALCLSQSPASAPPKWWARQRYEVMVRQASG